MQFCSFKIVHTAIPNLKIDWYKSSSINFELKNVTSSVYSRCSSDSFEPGGQIKRKENGKKKAFRRWREWSKKEESHAKYILNNYGYFEELLGTVRWIPSQILCSYRESTGRPLREEKSKSKWQREGRNWRRDNEGEGKAGNSYVYTESERILIAELGDSCSGLLRCKHRKDKREDWRKLTFRRKSIAY